MASSARSIASRLQAGLIATAMVAACAGPTGSTQPGSPAVAASVLIATDSPASSLETSAPSLDVTWTPFVSKRFRYSIDVPADWARTDATADWPDTGWPAPDGPAVDRFAAIDGAQVTVGSDRLDSGESAIGRRAEIDQETALACTVSNAGTIVIDGAEAQREDEFCFGKDHLIDVWLEHAGRVYLIDWLSSTEIGGSDRALFEAMLGRMRFTD